MNKQKLPMVVTTVPEKKMELAKSQLLVHLNDSFVNNIPCPRITEMFCKIKQYYNFKYSQTLNMCF